MPTSDDPGRPPLRLRVVRVHPTLDPAAGGIVSSLLATSRALAADHDLTILTWDGDPGHASAFEEHGVRVISAPRRTFRGFRQVLVDADLVVLEGAWNPMSPWVALRCRALGTPYVYVPHGSLSDLVRRQFPRQHRKKLAYWLLLERWVARGAIFTWHASEEEQRHSSGTFPGTPSSSAVIPFASRDVGATTRPAPRTDQPLEIVTATRVTPVKDLDVLLRALATRPGTWRLTVAGHQDPDYTEGLRRLADELGVSGQVRWLGFLTGPDMDALLREAHVYVCPGLESFGMSVAEALSSNLPVVASDAVALAPKLAQAGAVFPRGDSQELVRALATVEDRLRHGGSEASTPRLVWEAECSPQRFRESFAQALRGLRGDD